MAYGLKLLLQPIVLLIFYNMSSINDRMCGYLMLIFQLSITGKTSVFTHSGITIKKIYPTEVGKLSPIDEKHQSQEELFPGLFYKE